MKRNTCRTSIYLTGIAASLGLAGPALAQPYDLSWHTIDGGGVCTPDASVGGTYAVAGTIGQPDAATMAGGTYQIVGGFWAVAMSAGTGVPASTVTAAVSRKANASGAGGFCDLPLIPGVRSEPRQGGLSELRLTFDVAPGGPGPSPVIIEQATCSAPAYTAYSGPSVVSSAVAGNDLVLTFAPSLENARTYRLTIGSNVTSIAGQFVEVSGLVGDANSDGGVNASDRSVVVAAWTGGGFSCPTDLTGDGRTNASDRSVVVSAWTSGQNCAP